MECITQLLPTLLIVVAFVFIATCTALALRPKAKHKAVERVITIMSENNDVTIDLDLVQCIGSINKLDGNEPAYRFLIHLVDGTSNVKITTDAGFQWAVDVRRNVENKWKAYRNV